MRFFHSRKPFFPIVKVLYSFFQQKTIVKSEFLTVDKIFFFGYNNPVSR